MSMSKKHYEAIAKEFAHSYRMWDSSFDVDDRWPGTAAVLQLAGVMADIMTEDNPHFDRERFMTAAIPDYADYADA